MMSCFNHGRGMDDSLLFFFLLLVDYAGFAARKRSLNHDCPILFSAVSSWYNILKLPQTIKLEGI